MSWIDTHAHLNDPRFEPILTDVLARARGAGVERILVIGIDAASSRRALDLANRYPELRAVVGIQPNNLGAIEPGDWERVLELAPHPLVVGIGETGMDRYWDFAPIERQREYFLLHLDLSDRLEKPVVIHCRDAEADVIGVLREHADRSGKEIRGVMHSFTGEKETAATCMALGLFISFAGMVTFKKSQGLREVASSIPLDRLLVETDSPYLSPHPLRGKENEPSHVVHTGACLAAVHGISAEELASITTANARRLFHL